MECNLHTILKKMKSGDTYQQKEKKSNRKNYFASLSLLSLLQESTP